jgi:hypothetical protein
VHNFVTFVKLNFKASLNNTLLKLRARTSRRKFIGYQEGEERKMVKLRSENYVSMKCYGRDVGHSLLWERCRSQPANVMGEM